MITYKVNDKAKTLVDGRIVRILEAIPNGMRIYYVVEDCADDRQQVVQGDDLRPIVQSR